eukprot:11531508-Ditylum_brightwellii.AAC.1
MHSFDLFCHYNNVGTDALEVHTLAFVGDTVNGKLPVLFSLTTGAGGIAAERTLDLVRGAAASSFAPLAAHYVSLGHANGLVLSDVGGTPAPVQDLPCCLLIPTAWNPYFLQVNTLHPGMMLAMMEALCTHLVDQHVAEFYKTWVRAAWM